MCGDIQDVYKLHSSRMMAVSEFIQKLSEKWKSARAFDVAESFCTAVPMKHIALVLLLLTLAVFSQAREGPIRVLYASGAEADTNPTGPLHEAMRDLGRDAIWFDHVTNATGLEANYDLVLTSKDAGNPEE